MPIYKYLDLSTKHLSHDECMRLDDITTTVYHSYGAFVHVPRDEDADKDIAEYATDGFPELARLLGYAKHLDCNWINFDSDAEVEPTLPTFEW